MVSSGTGWIGAWLLISASMVLSPAAEGVEVAEAAWSTQLAAPVLAAPGASARSSLVGEKVSGRVTKVRWRVDYAQVPVLAKLCQQSRCLTLPASSGTSLFFAGLSASASFHFELQRQSDDSAGRRANSAASGELTLTVEYRPET